MLTVQEIRATLVRYLTDIRDYRNGSDNERAKDFLAIAVAEDDLWS